GGGDQTSTGSIARLSQMSGRELRWILLGAALGFVACGQPADDAQRSSQAEPASMESIIQQASLLQTSTAVIVTTLDASNKGMIEVSDVLAGIRGADLATFSLPGNSAVNGGSVALNSSG